MRRKDVEKALSSWFEVTSSAVSKSLRGLARPPLEMLRITEDPQSGREKLVQLTPHGERFLEEAIGNGAELMKWMTSHMSPQEVAGGIAFLTQVSEIFKQLPERGADAQSSDRPAFDPARTPD